MLEELRSYPTGRRRVQETRRAPEAPGSVTAEPGDVARPAGTFLGRLYPQHSRAAAPPNPTRGAEPQITLQQRAGLTALPAGRDAALAAVRAQEVAGRLQILEAAEGDEGARHGAAAPPDPEAVAAFPRSWSRAVPRRAHAQSRAPPPTPPPATAVT